MLQGLIHTSGGGWWHVRALRYRNVLWAPFRSALREWLDEWRPVESKLLLVGPSAGHTLPVDLLQARFHDITACEPDPLARHWLRRRLPGVRFTTPTPLNESGITRLALDHPDTAILFCNVLGQLSAPPAGWVAALAPLELRNWASFHDLLSTTRPADCNGPPSRLGAWQETGLDQIATHYWQGGVLELTDHQTFGLGDPTSRRHTLWRLTPRHWHVIGWGCHAGAQVAHRHHAPGP